MCLAHPDLAKSVWCVPGAIDYWQDSIVMCGRHGIAGSVRKVQSNDQGKGGRSVTGVHKGVTGEQNKTVTEGIENEWARKLTGA